MNIFRRFLLILLAMVALEGLAQTSSSNLTAPGATLQPISKEFKFTEGPAVDKKGNIFFTDQPNDKIWKYSSDGKLSLYMEKTGRANGLYFDKKGNIIACADEKNELWAISPKGSIRVLMDGFEGKKLNGPNDLWISPKGHIYFTDPYYQRDYWERKKPDMATQNVYFLPKGKKEPVLLDDGLKQPNGIVGTPDGKYLYVADIRDQKTYKYEIKPDGTLTNRQLFVAQGSDGITLDNQGNLYLSGRGITVYDSNGIKIETIAVPSGWVGNLCFGGKNRDMLFITASESIYTLQMQVKGVE
ncbi:MAG: SMP-30/gluconolactonase/LRE family protein [Spirosomataceae bacterium]